MPLVFREPELPTGFPDVVAVFCGERSARPPAARWRLGRDHLRLLHHLYTVRRASASELADALGWSSSRSLQVVLDDLENALLVRQHEGRVSARALASVFIARGIVAVEAKIHDWQQALRQAIANTWFASQSYILMPSARLKPAAFDHAARFGIGVMTYNGQRTKVELGARRHRIPASYGSWLVNEWAVRHTARSR